MIRMTSGLNHAYMYDNKYKNVVRKPYYTTI